MLQNVRWICFLRPGANVGGINGDGIGCPKRTGCFAECLSGCNAYHIGIQQCKNKEIDTDRIKNELENRRVVIVTGFQGVNKFDNYATLGRGGSDTTAVALAVPSMQNKCEFIRMLTEYIPQIRE